MPASSTSRAPPSRTDRAPPHNSTPASAALWPAWCCTRPGADRSARARSDDRNARVISRKAREPDGDDFIPLPMDSAWPSADCLDDAPRTMLRPALRAVRADTQAIDLWLRGALRHAYGEPVRTPLSEELCRLL